MLGPRPFDCTGIILQWVLDTIIYGVTTPKNCLCLFQIIDVIAKGTYGNVYMVRREDEKQNYAVKVCLKRL